MHVTEEWKYNLVIRLGLLVLEVSAKKAINNIVFLYIYHYGGSVRTWRICVVL